MGVQVQNCERFLDRRWTLSVHPADPWWSRRAGYCQRCMALAEAADDLGKWWHIDYDNYRECRDPNFAYQMGGSNQEPRFIPDPNLQASIMQAIKEGKPKYGFKSHQNNLRVGLAKPGGFSHDAVCACTPCQLLRDPQRQVPGKPGEIYVTHEEYMKLKDEAFEAARYSGHPPGCDCRGCDRGY